VASAPRRSGELALRLPVLFGALGGLGLFTTLAAAQGQLDNFGSQSDAQRPMANAINTMCPNLDASNPLVPVCGNLVFNEGGSGFGGYQLSQDELNAATQRLNGEEVQAIQQQVGDVRATQVAAITARMEAIRAGLAPPGLSFAGLTLDDEQIRAAGYEDDAVAEGGDSLVGEGGSLTTPTWDKLGVFVTGGGSFGDKSNSSQVTGYDFYTVGLTTGADYRLSDDFAVGAAIGYAYNNVDFDQNQNNASDQDLDANSVIFSFFGTYFPNSDSLVPLEGLFVDGMASFGWSFFDMSRHIVIPSNNPTVPSLDEKANSDTTAFQYGFAGNVGYEFNIRQFTITPVARVQYVKADVDSYEESGASPINLDVGSQDATSLTTNLGASLGYAFSTRYGVIEPSVRAEYVHEFENDDDGARVQYADDPTGLSAFDVIIENPNRNYGIVGAAVTGTLAGGWSTFADFETVVGFGRFDIYTLRAGLRKEF
jgi:uncharacterized protein with beta-barrel porin domain